MKKTHLSAPDGKRTVCGYPAGSVWSRRIDHYREVPLEQRCKLCEPEYRIRDPLYTDAHRLTCEMADVMELGRPIPGLMKAIEVLYQHLQKRGEQ